MAEKIKKKTETQKEVMIQKLRKQGCRMTKQRNILLDVILKEECSCCKEIYYMARQTDSRIGLATVYRMMDALENTGVISRKRFYKIVDREGEIL